MVWYAMLELKLQSEDWSSTMCNMKLISLLQRFYTICLLINILEILLISLCVSIWPVSAALSGRVS